MSLLIPLAAALIFACENPTHHDGDGMRCAGREKSMRMYGIDAPEMPGSCRPGRQCTPGDPYAARDYLASLTAGRSVKCEQLDTDVYGRPVVRCTADGMDLGCAMVASRHAVERYGRLDCTGAATSASAAPAYEDVPAPIGYQPKVEPVPVILPPSRIASLSQFRKAPPMNSGSAFTNLELAGTILAALLLINGLTWTLFSIDRETEIKSRYWRTTKQRRVPEVVLLGLAALGGSPSALIARHNLRHKTFKQPFSNLLIGIAGVQAGVLAGLALFWSGII